MKVYSVVLSRRAEAQLASIERIVAERDSPLAAARFIERLNREIEKLEIFPERGTVQPDLSPGIRITGIHKNVSIAFVVHETVVEVLRITYAGQRLNL